MVDYPYKSNDPVMRCVPVSRSSDLPSSEMAIAAHQNLMEQVRSLLSLRVRQSDICAWLGVSLGEVQLVKACCKDD